jgi:hypothetical protein
MNHGEDFGSAIERGALRFSGFREKVDYRTPDKHAMAMELIEATDAREDAYQRFQEALASGARPAKVDRLEREYAAAQERVRLIESDGVDDWQLEEGRAVSMAAALGRNLDEDRRAQRLEDFHVFMSFCAQGSISDPWQMFKNFLALLRRVAPEMLGNLSQTELAAILGETKGAVSAREIRVVEAVQKRWGVKGFHGFGGSKGENARAAFSAAQKGNQNRRTGAKAKHRKAVATARPAEAVAAPVKTKRAANAAGPKRSAKKQAKKD